MSFGSTNQGFLVITHLILERNLLNPLDYTSEHYFLRSKNALIIVTSIQTITRTNQKTNKNQNTGVNPPNDTFKTAVIIPAKRKIATSDSKIRRYSLTLFFKASYCSSDICAIYSSPSNYMGPLSRSCSVMFLTLEVMSFHFSYNFSARLKTGS
jgi:hypothetical protein